MDSGPELVHLGGKNFCYFTLHEVHSSGRTRVRCTKFRVTKLVRPPPEKPEGTMGKLKGSIVSSFAYVVDQPLDLWAHGLLLDGMPIRTKDDEVDEEVAGQVFLKPKGRENCTSTKIKFED